MPLPMRMRRELVLACRTCKIGGVEPHQYLVALFDTLSAANTIDSDAVLPLSNT
jgi:hypothetical protein